MASSHTNATRSRPVGGCIPSNKQSQQQNFGSFRKYSDKQLPSCVDLRALMTPVEDQGQTNSCVGNALAAAYEFLIMKNSKKHVDVSRLFIYYNSRLLDGQKENDMQDQGTMIENAVKSLKKYGCCKEVILPFDEDKINRKPNEKCYSEGRRFRVEEVMSIQNSLSEMKACLAQGYPFVFGIETFESFHNTGQNGFVSIPNPQIESRNKNHGWHAMLAAGYDDAKQCFIVKNSWGETWGDRGYAYIPYGYMGNPNHCVDLHSIKLISSGVPEDDEGLLNNSKYWENFFLNKPIGFVDFQYFSFDDQWFWRSYNPIDFSYWHSNAGQRYDDQVSFKPVIIWIDEKTEENIKTANKIQKACNVPVSFIENPLSAEKYLTENIEQIRKKSLQEKPLQIICRGFYKSVNQSPLHILKFLNQQNIRRIPIVIFTRDRQGTQYHLSQQAPSMGIADWKTQFHITSDVHEVIQILAGFY